MEQTLEANNVYLKGAIPYPKEVIEEYTLNGWWMNLTYIDILDRTIAKYKEKVALVDDHQRLTYAELGDQVDRFASALLEIGIQKRDRVIIQLPNLCEFFIAYFGMQRIGAIPVIAIPRYEEREISQIIELTKAVGWIVTTQDGSRDFKSIVEAVRPGAKSLKNVIMVNAEEDLSLNVHSMKRLIQNTDLGKYSDMFEQLKPNPNDVAHILLTGGTTGRSKAVPRTHNSFLCSVRYTNKNVTSDDILLLATPVGHTMAHQGPIGSAFLHGGTLVMVGVPRPQEILEVIEKEKITYVGLVPTQLIGILEHRKLEKYNLNSLKALATAGAELRPEVAEKARLLCAKINCTFRGGGYGSSEGPAAVHDSEPPTELMLRSVGKPLSPGDKWIVIDENEQELPPNIVGELAVIGPTVFTGYYGFNEQNHALFTESGFYKTGDLGKIDEHGYIYITGRKKDIIQRGGEGIVPSEIEDLLHLHPDVDKAAVVGMPDPHMGERACAFVIPKQGRNFNFDGMINFLKEQGAGVLLRPERLEIVEELPLTGVGKIDKKALRKNISEKLKKEGVLTE